MTAEVPPVIDLPDEAAREVPQVPQEPEAPDPEEVTVEVEGQPAADAPGDGVIVLIERQDNGAIKTAILPQGDVRITEIPTVVEIALNQFKSENGLS